ncbi:sialate O-acetylesterase (plasmid) [Thioclava sp. 'Guangxiensis']|uniref:sialate O-acetylesterase n=1 Tax=Thioclava sp. 'Guangxiensis' TaxID=3149044 RepID=UPI0032C41BD2
MIGIGSGFMAGGGGLSLRRNSDGTVTATGTGSGLRWSVDGGASWTEAIGLPVTLPVTAAQAVQVIGLGGAQTLPGQIVQAFLLVGQSNMVGRAYDDGGARFPANTAQWTQAGALEDVAGGFELDFADTVLETSDRFGPALQFAIDYAQANPADRIVLIPCAVGNTGFVDNRWKVGDDLYAAAVARSNAFFAANPGANLRAVLWHQGESDAATQAAATAYEANFDAMLAGFEAEISAMGGTTPVIVGGFSDDNLQQAYIGTVEAVHEDLPNRRAYTACVSADDLTLRDTVHFDAASQRVLGARYFAALAVAEAHTSLPEAPAVSAEAGASAHYLFGTDNSSDTDLNGAQALLDAPESRSAGYLSTAASANGGLETPVPDAESFTLIMVMRARDAGTGGGIFGGSIAASGEGNSGWGIFENGGVAYHNAKVSGGGNDLMVAETPSPLSTSAWTFVAGTVSPTTQAYFHGASGGSVYVSDAHARSLGTVANIGLGPTRYASFTKGYDIAEAILYSGMALSQAELQAVYERSLTRLAARGITLG